MRHPGQLTTKKGEKIIWKRLALLSRRRRKFKSFRALRKINFLGQNRQEESKGSQIAKL